MKSALQFAIWKPILTATLLILSLSEKALAHGDSEHEMNAEIREMEEARIQQYIYFQKLEREKLRQQFAASANPLLHLVTNGPAPAPATPIERDPYHYVSSISKPAIPKVVTLTFDDGPHPAITPTVLDILARHKVKATFFILGAKVAGQEELIERMVREGHLVANHSQSHANFHKISTEEQIQEVNKAHTAIAPFYGDRIRLFRYPYGNGGTASRNHIRETKKYAGIVGWHVDTCDWAYAKNGSVTFTQQKICGVRDENVSNFAGHVLENIERKKGGIVLFHDVHQRTMDRLEFMIEALKSSGYKFSNLDDPRMTQYFR